MKLFSCMALSRKHEQKTKSKASNLFLECILSLFYSFAYIQLLVFAAFVKRNTEKLQSPEYRKSMGITFYNLYIMLLCILMNIHIILQFAIDSSSAGLFYGVTTTSFSFKNVDELMVMCVIRYEREPIPYYGLQNEDAITLITAVG